jgi:hypothetical protein
MPGFYLCGGNPGLPKLIDVYAGESAEKKQHKEQ